MCTEFDIYIFFICLILIFSAGDVRCNVQPGLGSLHLLFVREHNRIVTELKAVKTWTDEEELFSVTRKIIGAIIQHITYKEYFGSKNCKYTDKPVLKGILDIMFPINV